MASQYSTILASDSSTAVNQYDVIKYSDYESLKSNYETALSNYNTLYNKVYSVPSSFYNLRVEGGGIIFFDWKYGFTGAATTGKEGCSVSADTKSDLGDYDYDNITGEVHCRRVGSKHRFYVVAESDLTNSTVGWDTVDPEDYKNAFAPFGTGKANTTYLCKAITNDVWPLVETARATNPSGHTLVSDDSALDTRWFVPSKNELYVLNAMQYSDSSYRPSGIPQLSINYSAGTLSQYYWSSSQHTSTLNDAWCGNFSLGRMHGNYKNDTTSLRVRLCRTF
jgi:hypothetical protein